MIARQIYDDKFCPSFLQRWIYFETKVRKVNLYNPENFIVILLVPSYLNLMLTQVLEGGKMRCRKTNSDRISLKLSRKQKSHLFMSLKRIK
jgi:hypothetical protein